MAHSLLAIRDGERGEEAETGALLLAEGLQNLQICSDFARAYANAMRAHRG
jgi:hypothetical protein